MNTDVLYKRVYNVLRAGIVNGTYPPGSRLPTEPELMEQFQVSRVTTRQALTMLKEEGLIVSMPAKGTFVAKTSRAQELNKKLIVVLTPDVDTGFFSKIIRGVEREAYAHGFHVIVHATNDLVAVEDQFLKELSTEVAGFVIAAAAIGAHDPSGYQEVIARGVPFVFVDRALSDMVADMVVSDNVCGGYLATRHLLELGHTRIGVIVPRGCASYTGRVEGYLQALKEFGVASDPALIAYPEEESPNGNHTEYYRQGGLLAEKLLTLSSPPTAVFSFNNMAAVGALRCLQSQGIVVPDQMALVGYDGVDATGYVTPTITTIDQEPLQLGALSAQILLARIRGEVMPPQNISLSVTLCVRESSAPAETERHSVEGDRRAPSAH